MGGVSFLQFVRLDRSKYQSGRRPLAQRENTNVKISKIMLAAAASCMSVAPAMAAPTNPAASLSVAQSARAGSVTAKDSQAAAGLAGSGLIIAAVAAVAVIVGIVLITDGDDDSDSN
jgi:hypothetical protein